MHRHRQGRPSARGQTLVELALVFPLFVMVLFGIIILGIGIFYQQQVTNAAREAARWAAVHSATSDCPTIGTLHPSSIDPESGYTGAYAAVEPMTYIPDLSATCYDDWQPMRNWARNRLFGINRQAVNVTACWSSYWDTSSSHFDAPPPGAYPSLGTFNTTWEQCTIGGQDPTVSPSSIDCTGTLVADDTGSAMSEGPAVTIGNRVTAYACYRWQPPLAGFLLIPGEVILRGVISEPIQRQQ